METSRFDYDLPRPLIAQRPVEPRDASRLLDTRDLSNHSFSDLPGLLSPGDVLVVNRSRVRAARIQGTRSSGGRIELLILHRDSGSRWRALAKPARKLRPGMGLNFERMSGEVVDRHEGGEITVDLEPQGDTPVEDVIEQIGVVPYPPYVTDGPSDPERYQTVYADRLGSAAAPTAGLHFTEDLFDQMKASGIDMAAVDLEVGLATFSPMVQDRIEDHLIHAERYEIPASTSDAITTAHSSGGSVVAVGTTVVRALESSAVGPYRVASGSRSTELFITPGFHFNVVDLLVTNFHLPRSSLLVLVEAFMGESWTSAYETALMRGYRFLSFGDAMLAARE